MMIFLCGMMVVAGTACKNENAPEDKTVQKRHLTIKMSDDAAGMPIRRIKDATITPEGNTLLAEWTAGDQATYCNLSRQDEGAPYKGTLTAVSTGVKSDLTGDVECTADDYLAVVYPANSTFPYNDPGTNYTYTFLLSGQDGTLAKLATSYHQVYGRAHVLSVDDKTATATMDKMQSLLTLCKFSFVEKDHEANGALPINTLTIAYGGNDSKTNKYPQSATVTVTNLTENSAAQAVGATPSEALTINADGATEVYVALLPDTGTCEYKFTVTNGSDTYTGTASAWLKKGEYVVATNLRLTQQ